MASVSYDEKHVFFWLNSLTVGQQLQLMCAAKSSTTWEVGKLSSSVILLVDNVPLHTVAKTKIFFRNFLTIQRTVWTLQLLPTSYSFTWLNFQRASFYAEMLKKLEQPNEKFLVDKISDEYKNGIFVIWKEY